MNANSMVLVGASLMVVKEPNQNIGSGSAM